MNEPKPLFCDFDGDTPSGEDILPKVYRAVVRLQRIRKGPGKGRMRHIRVLEEASPAILFFEPSVAHRLAMDAWINPEEGTHRQYSNVWLDQPPSNSLLNTRTL